MTVVDLFKPENAKNSSSELTLNSLLVDLLTIIKLQGYEFVTVSPTTHEYFFAKNSASGRNLRDIFGWNLPFHLDALCPLIQKIMTDACLLDHDGELMRSKLRISSLGKDLFFHSAFPTVENDAVFFGPDTYRFARFIKQTLKEQRSTIPQSHQQSQKSIRILDIGCGTGAGGFAAVRSLPYGCLYELIFNDINDKALELALINASVADISIKAMPGDILSQDIFKTAGAEFDLIISNPPFMKDESARTYRDGGGMLGLDLSIRILQLAFEHLAIGGTLLLYTGVAMTNESDPFLSSIKPLLASANCDWSYEEIDPDIFGEELILPSYKNAYRIAAVGLVVTRR